jgi:hypothetical protein
MGTNTQRAWPYTTWPERTVVRTGVSPMNPKVKWAELDCGHDIFRAQAEGGGHHRLPEVRGEGRRPITPIKSWTIQA